MSPGRLLDVVGNFLIPFESYLTSNDGPEINITRLQTTANFSKQIAVVSRKMFICLILFFIQWSFSRIFGHQKMKPTTNPKIFSQPSKISLKHSTQPYRLTSIYFSQSFFDFHSVRFQHIHSSSLQTGEHKSRRRYSRCDLQTWIDSKYRLDHWQYVVGHYSRLCDDTFRCSTILSYACSISNQSRFPPAANEHL